MESCGLKPGPDKLGSMTIPRTSLEHAPQQVFDSPQNQNNSKLSPQIARLNRERHPALVIR